MSAITLISPRDNSNLVFDCQWKPSLGEIAPALLASPKETDLVKLLMELSHAFNARTELLKKYGRDSSFVSAYTQVFLPTNIPKFEFLLKQLPSWLLHAFHSHRWQFIDFGCGPGTYSLAWLKQFTESTCLPIDYADAMLDQAKSLINHIYGKNKLANTVDSERRRVLCFGNVINEVDSNVILKQIKEFSPQVIFFIEPGTKACFEQIALLRNQLIDSEYKILYPCFSQAECPIAPQGNAIPEDWCHQVIRMSHDPSVERLCQLARLDRKILPMIGHVYVKQGFDNQHIMNDKSSVLVEAGRIIQFIQENKHAFEYRVCLSENDHHAIKKCIIAKKTLTKDQKKLLKKASIGTNLYFTIVKENQQQLQIKLV